MIELWRVDWQMLNDILLIATLESITLWLVRACLSGTKQSRRLQVNSVKGKVVYSNIFLAYISIRYEDTKFEGLPQALTPLLRMHSDRKWKKMNVKSIAILLITFHDVGNSLCTRRKGDKGCCI